MVRRDRVPDFEASWALVFDPARQRGPFVLIDSMRDMLGVALKAAGRSVNSTDPEDVRRAGEAVLAAKRSALSLGFEGGVGGKNKVLSGAAALAIVYNGDALRGMEEDPGVAFEVPHEGSILWVDAMAVPARAPHPQAAHRFIDYLLRPEVGARLARFNRYATPNRAAFDLLTPEERSDAAVYPPPEVRRRLEYIEDVGEATRLYDEVWTAVKAR
jgi:spermidine/putrescine transport system substrate-binding protein